MKMHVKIYFIPQDDYYLVSLVAFACQSCVHFLASQAARDILMIWFHLERGENNIIGIMHSILVLASL